MYETKVSVDRSGRRKEMVRWPQVDERRQNEGRRFSDAEPDPVQAAVDREVDLEFARFEHRQEQARDARPSQDRYS